jgi:uncharacterized Zn-binding protein involved in type VI secretion
MGMGPIACYGARVYFPKCGMFYVISGSPNFLEGGLPVARVGDLVNAPGFSIIVQGSSTLVDGGQPVARIGDKAISTSCGSGFIVSGSTSFMES